MTAHKTPIADLQAPPAPRDLAANPDAELQAALGLTSARTRTLRAAAEKWANGFTFAQLTAAEARRALPALPGIGH
ncbi:hypothetical protein ACWD5Q_34350 [Streptomyces sp. NPDC002513]